MKVFISHSSKDKPFVRKLKKDLELNYIDSWLDEDELLPGDSLMNKLSTALKDSTHFMIVLSPNSVESDWVNYELDNALKYVEEETLSKIIPVHYRECNIPETLKPILNIDLTKETVYYRHGELEFLGNNYYNLLKALIRSIQSGSRELLETDKNDITGENAINHKEQNEIFSFHYKVIGYKSVSNFIANQVPDEAKEQYTKKSLEDFNPVLLPKQLEKFIGKIKFGETIKFKNSHGDIIEGDFAKFSTSNNRIVIPLSIRNFLGIREVKIYNININTGDKSISIKDI
mgnify:CR=1 FL=1